MLTVSSLTDIITAIGLSREEAEPNFKRGKPKQNHLVNYRTFYQPFLLLGVIEGTAVLFTFLAVMGHFGFTFESMQKTRFHVAFVCNGSYNASSPWLGNIALQFNTSIDSPICTPGFSISAGTLKLYERSESIHLGEQNKRYL